MTDEQFGRKMAAKDLREIAASDCLILDLEAPSSTMGKMIEYGFAVANHKLIYVVGTPPQGAIFLLLADGLFPDWGAMITHIRENH